MPVSRGVPPRTPLFRINEFWHRLDPSRDMTFLKVLPALVSPGLRLAFLAKHGYHLIFKSLKESLRPIVSHVFKELIKSHIPLMTSTLKVEKSRVKFQV